MANMKKEIPLETLLVHRQVGKTHVFTCKSAPGLHIGSGDLRVAFEGAIEGLSQHFSRLAGSHIMYKADKGFEEFENALTFPSRDLSASFVTVKQMSMSQEELLRA